MKSVAIILLSVAALFGVADSRRCFPTNCGSHASYYCGSTCGDLNCGMQSLAAVSCIPGCFKGCFCDEGYVRGPNEDCIAVEKCPVCPENEHFKQCGSACESTCDDPVEEGDFCIAACANKCFCNYGYVRDSSGTCILAESCPTPN